MQSVLGTESFKMSQLGLILDGALEQAPLTPVHITHRLSLSTAELKPTVVDVGIRVASERAVPIQDYSETFGQIDAKLKDLMQEVGVACCVASADACCKYSWARRHMRCPNPCRRVRAGRRRRVLPVSVVFGSRC
jgi:hypothetical protein